MVDAVYAHVARDSAEAKDWEQLVVVVGLDHHAHTHQSLLVLVLRAEVVERCRITWVAIRRSVVNSDGHSDLPACAEIVDKARSHGLLLSSWLWVRCFQGLRPHDELSVLLVSFLELGVPGLSGSSHEFTHGNFNFSD